MDEDQLQSLYELFPNSDPEYLAQVLYAHNGDLQATVEALIPHVPQPVEVLRPPSPFREQPRGSTEVDAFKRDLGMLLQGQTSTNTNNAKPLGTLIKEKLKKWFHRKKKVKEEVKDSASTVSPSEPDEEVISFYAPEGLRKGEHPAPGI